MISRFVKWLKRVYGLDKISRKEMWDSMPRIAQRNRWNAHFSSSYRSVFVDNVHLMYFRMGGLCISCDGVDIMWLGRFSELLTKEEREGWLYWLKELIEDSKECTFKAPKAPKKIKG